MLFVTKTIALAATAVAAFGAASFAGQVRVNDASGYLNGTDPSGGAFIATSLVGYNGETGGPGGSATTFATFCLERNEFLNFGNTYYTELSTSAKGGGYGGQVGGVDPISSATALLYQTFRNGGSIPLGGIGAIDTADEVSGMQYAIWRLENEGDGGNAFVGTAGVEAAAAAMTTWANANNNGSLYNVRVLRMWANPDLTGNIQDLLAVVPTPEAAMAGFSLMAGLGVVRLVKRFRRDQELA